jgi:hypothetical protein
MKASHHDYQHPQHKSNNTVENSDLPGTMIIAARPVTATIRTSKVQEETILPSIEEPNGSPVDLACPQCPRTFPIPYDLT